MSSSRTGPLTFLTMDRDSSSMNSTRTWVTPPLEPVRPRTLMTLASLIGVLLSCFTLVLFNKKLYMHVHLCSRKRSILSNEFATKAVQPYKGNPTVDPYAYLSNHLSQLQRSKLILWSKGEISSLLASRRAVHSQLKVDKPELVVHKSHTHIYTQTSSKRTILFWLNLLSLVVNRRKSFSLGLTTLRCAVSGLTVIRVRVKFPFLPFWDIPKNSHTDLANGVKPLSHLAAPTPLFPGTIKSIKLLISSVFDVWEGYFAELSWRIDDSN